MQHLAHACTACLAASDCTLPWMVRNSALKSAAEKLTRAREQIVALQAEERRFTRENPEPFSFQLEQDVETDRIVAIVSSIKEPTILSLILGELIHDLRSVLDHIAWQLYRHGATPQLSPGAERRVQFPIEDSPSSFAQRLRDGWLPGVRDVHLSVVRMHQPYNGAHPAIEWLRDLSNQDKHRSIHTVLWVPTNPRVSVGRVPSGCQVLGTDLGPDVGRPVAIGSKLALVRLSDPDACLGLEVRCHARIIVQIEGFGILHKVVSAIEREVSDILMEIDRSL